MSNSPPPPPRYHHQQASTSIRVLRSFVRRSADGFTVEDVSGLISRACYEEWLRSRFVAESDAEAGKFRRVFINHVSGSDGRVPFAPDEEAAILVLLRRKAPWPCFPPHLRYLGLRVRVKGYHEKLAAAAAASAAATTTTTSAAARRPLPSPLQCNTAAAASAQATDASAAPQLLQLLPPADAHYLADFCRNVAQNHNNTPAAVYDAVKYMILARTDRCRKSVPAVPHALALCEQFSHCARTAVLVLDMAAKAPAECVLARNAASEPLFQDEGGGGGCSLFQHDVHRMLLVMSTAFHLPGLCVSLGEQRVSWREPGGGASIVALDLDYYVDPNSFFLVVFGSPGLDEDDSDGDGDEEEEEEEKWASS